MIRRLLGAAACALIAGACSEVSTDPDLAVAISFDSLPAPSVVVGDSLRDISGVARPLRARAFNFRGELIPGAVFRYFAADRGLRVDSVTGHVIGDSVRASAPRVIASLGGIQVLRSLDVVERPDSVAAGARDSLLYSVTDSTLNISAPLPVTVLHRTPTGTTPVRSYPVSFAIVSPADSLTAHLVNDASLPSKVDTTDNGGVAGRRVKLRPLRLSSVRDSVVIQATVRYRGAHVAGSPARIVLLVKPR